MALTDTHVLEFPAPREVNRELYRRTGIAKNTMAKPSFQPLSRLIGGYTLKKLFYMEEL